MEPITIGMGLAGLAGDIFGSIFSADERDAANAAYQQAIDQINAVGAPPELAREIILKHFDQAGLYTPQLEEAINLGVSKVSQIQEDQKSKQAQDEALQLIGQRARTGLTPEDRSAFNQLRRETQREAEAKRQQILQNFQARGQAGSGAELAAQLSSAQSGDEKLAAAGDNISAEASRRALESLSAYSGAATNARGQSFDIDRAKAAAEDDFSKFNTQNQISRQARNVASQNDAAKQNLSEKQRIADSNVNVDNTQTMNRVAQKQADWGNKLGYAKTQNNALMSKAAQDEKNADRIASNWSNVGGGISDFLGKFGTDKILGGK